MEVTEEFDDQPEVVTGESGDQSEVVTGESGDQPEVVTGESGDQSEVVTGESGDQPEVVTGESGDQSEVVTGESGDQPEVVIEESGEPPVVVAEESGEHSADITDNLEGVSFAPKPRKRGRPKGSCTTAIGMPRQKRQKVTGKPQPFHKKDTTTRQRHLLSFFLDEESVANVFTCRTLVGEEAVEMAPENIPSAILDNDVDIKIIQKIFSGDGWAALEAVYTACKSLPWTCHRCTSTLQENQPSIGCDSCLNWYHWNCEGVKTRPKTKFWFCKNCKN